MADEEKKNGEYEKPESHDVGGDQLEGVSAGKDDIWDTVGGRICGNGSINTGAQGCQVGAQPMVK